MQYGLFAEEVDKIYPELVIRRADGRIDGVRYEELAPMLLNEVLKQRAMIEAQAQQMPAFKAVVAQLQLLLAGHD